MSTFTLTYEMEWMEPVHAAFDRESDVLGILRSANSIELWRFDGLAEPKRIGHCQMLEVPLGCEPYQVAIAREPDGEAYRVVLLCSSSLMEPPYQIYTYFLRLDNTERCLPPISDWSPSPVLPLTLHSGTRNFWVSAPEGSISFDDFGPVSERLSHPPDCQSFDMVDLPDGQQLIVSLANSGRLSVGQHIIDKNCTSFILCGTFLVYTTASHMAHFVPISALAPIATPSLEGTVDIDLSSCETRRLERGSRIVTAVASSMTLVLQMPRGNLEIICPRPLVLQVVAADLEAHRYRQAFLHCRKHRIDLNTIYDQDPQGLIQNLDAFVDQVHEVEHLNLFLSSLK